MLDPEYLDEAGDLVAACYSGIEAEMLAYLSGLLAEHGPERLGQRGETALELLAQTRAPELRAIIESHSGDVSQAVRAAVLDALDRSDRADAARIGKRAEAAIAGLPREAAATVEGIAAILERDNVDMVQGSLALWNRTVAAAAAEVATGYADAQTAIRRAVRKMAREGITTVTYRDSETGRQTVTNRIDVAVRRHVRTQIAQDGMRRTERICEAADVELVEVSSHSPARPDHAAWQGRIFSLHGDVTVEGVRYHDLREATGYGTVTGLGGANCRHFFGPWLPGTPRMYEPDPPHPSGLPNDEVYALSQRQRARERSIRATKRELACAQSAGEKAAEVAGGQWSMRDIAEVERLKAKLRGQQKAMRDFIEDANSRGKAPVLRRAPVREWAGDMPRIRKGGAAKSQDGPIAMEVRVTKKSEKNDYSVNRKIVNGGAYQSRFLKLGLPRAVALSACSQARRLLEDRDGLRSERLIAISRKNGRLLADTFNLPAIDGKCDFTDEQKSMLSKVDGGVVLIHNHPLSSDPSYTDLFSLHTKKWVEASIVACHDGSVLMPKILDGGFVGRYNELVDEYLQIHTGLTDMGKIELLANETLCEENKEQRWFSTIRA